MKLHATPKSHFSRKLRLLLDHLKLDYTFVDVGNVADAEAARFSGNPLMRVPVLEDGDTWLIESDHIAGYIVDRYDPEDRYGVRDTTPANLNARAIMNGIMDNEVKLILAARTGLDPAGHAYFDKAASSMAQGLAWLEAAWDTTLPAGPGYAHFHFISMWDHLKLYALMPLPYPRLAQLADTLAQQPDIARSAPPA